MAKSAGQSRADEALTMQDMLAKLKDIVASLDAGQRETLMRQLNVAEERYCDSRLNLAIIGEYSSGKSTFINALFQKEILATDMQPTTAVPTYITWSVRSPVGGFGSYLVTAHGSNGNSFALHRDGGRKAFEDYAGIRLPEDSDRLIDAVTTDNRLSGCISRVDVKAPLNEKYQGICLIDTPGVNPGTDGTADHVRVTQEVLRDAADAAIIMFPAERVYTASFGSFLQENASHLLKHSIFVITKCDMIRSSKGLEELRDFVAHHLSMLGVDEPEVHCISAVYALDAYLDGDSADEKARMWQKRFENTIETIFMEMADRRNSIVHANVTAVVEQITTLLTDSLGAKREQLDSVQKELEKASPEKMKEECGQMLEVFQEKMKERRIAHDALHEGVIGGAIERKWQQMLRAIDLCGSKEEVSICLSGFNQHAMSGVEAAIGRSIQDFRQSLGYELAAYRTWLNECYERYHLNVSAAAVNTLKMSTSDIVDVDHLKAGTKVAVTGSVIFRNTLHGIDGVFNTDSIPEAAIAVVLELAVMPLVVVEQIYNVFRSLEKTKREAKEKVRKALESARVNAGKSMEESLDQVYSAYLNAVTQLPEKVVEAFLVEFEEARIAYDNQMRHTNDQIAAINERLHQLSVIAQQLFWR
ncbi:MAG: dynamin family protein [Clostridia bacterium]|nr:dynamin family protein [Clostridia bacterium]